MENENKKKPKKNPKGGLDTMYFSLKEKLLMESIFQMFKE